VVARAYVEAAPPALMLLDAELVLVLVGLLGVSAAPEPAEV